ncbi:MAG: hypothetical protein WDO56_05065 [Gammaproteobacteria bacterium]
MRLHSPSTEERLIGPQATERRLRDGLSAFGVCSFALPVVELHRKDFLQGGLTWTAASDLADLLEAQAGSFQ